jgi:hypothetical protein
MARRAVEIRWTTHARFRRERRGFQVPLLEHILRTSTERYSDTVTGRRIVVGRHESLLVLIAYETDGDTIVPVSVHATTRRDIQARLHRGHYIYG